MGTRHGGPRCVMMSMNSALCLSQTSLGTTHESAYRRHICATAGGSHKECPRPGSCSSYQCPSVVCVPTRGQNTTPASSQNRAMCGPASSLNNAMDLNMGGRSQNLSFSPSGVWISTWERPKTRSSFMACRSTCISVPGPADGTLATVGHFRWQCPPADNHCHAGVGALGGLPLPLPDGHKRVDCKPILGLFQRVLATQAGPV